MVRARRTVALGVETTSGHAIKEASCEKNRRANEKGVDTPAEAVGGPPRGHEGNHGATESPNVQMSQTKFGLRANPRINCHNTRHHGPAVSPYPPTALLLHKRRRRRDEVSCVLATSLAHMRRLLTWLAIAVARSHHLARSCPPLAEGTEAMVQRVRLRLLCHCFLLSPSPSPNIQEAPDTL